MTFIVIALKKYIHFYSHKPLLFWKQIKGNLAHQYQRFNQAIETISQESRMIGSYDFDFESFKKELLKEIGDETR